MQTFLTFLAFYALCSVIVRAQNESDCVNKYFAVNTFKDLEEIEVSCYSKTSSCNVTYSPPGINNVVLLNAEVPANQTIKFAWKIVLGGKLRSNHQFGVFYLDFEDENIFAQLPRASDAGTKFVAYFWFGPKVPVSRFETCYIAALNESADLTYQIGSSTPENINLVRFETQQKIIEFSVVQNVTIKVNSTAPVIISCYNSAHFTFNTWQPISSEPVFDFMQPSAGVEYATISLSDCKTSKEITDLSKVSIQYDTSDGYNCTQKSNTIYGSFCGILVTPIDTSVCVSITKQDGDSLFRGMGIPKSKRTVGGYDLNAVLEFFFFSYNKSNCEFIDGNGNPVTLPNVSFDGALSQKVFIQSPLDRKLILDAAECYDPVYVFINYLFPVSGGSTLYPVEAIGLQSEDIWEPMFNYTGCDYPGPPTPP